jgi:uncharacterized protein
MLNTDLLNTILCGYTLPPMGLHGMPHWARVLENGLRLTPTTGADPEVVALFALFHDARRVNEGRDPAHGARGALLVRTLGPERLGLDPARTTLLQEACEFHSEGRTDGERTVQTCWDADRLDLPRCGIVPDTARLGTQAGRDPIIRAWAADRAVRHVVPGRVELEWLPAIQPGITQSWGIRPGSREQRM